MIRRLCAAFVLVVLVSQTGVSLYACHRVSGAGHHALASGHGGGAVPHAPSHHHDTALAAAADADHAQPAAPGQACNRHHPGRCPHAADATFHRCTSDPVEGLRAAAEAGLPAVASLAALRAPLLPLATPPLQPRHVAAAPAPELPPPRA